MDLDKFLERDVIEFLEQKDLERKEKREVISEEVEEFSMDKDYYQIFREALEKRDLYSAKKMFEEVKEKFAKAETDVEKNTFTGLIENMYTDLKNFDAKEDVEKEFVKEITGMEAITKEPIDDKKAKQEKELVDKKIKIKNEIAVHQEKTAEFLQKMDLEAAMSEYRKMKGSFEGFPDGAKQEKEEIFNDVISSYYQIKRLENLKKKETSQEDRKKDDERRRILSKTKQEVLLSTKKTKVFLQQGDLKKAMIEYDSNLKKTFEMFPKDMIEEKRALYHLTLKVYDQIHKKSEEIKRSGTTKKDRGKEKEVPEHKEHLDFIMDLKKEVRATITLMKERKIVDAGHKLLEIKRRMNNFPEDKVMEKAQFEHLIEEITHRLNFLRQSLEVKNA
ncbi:hypothetical protein HQ533_05535 [Candidatus Woesearchaeota archaeon]|nr:hypothetical protein [Candidatus Woesearchaeota archaeon]